MGIGIGATERVNIPCLRHDNSFRQVVFKMTLLLGRNQKDINAKPVMLQITGVHTSYIYICHHTQA